MKASIYIDREDYREVEKEEQQRFVRGIVEKMIAPSDRSKLDECWPPDEYKLSVDDRIKLRSIYNKYNIVLIDDKDGGIKIYVGKEIVAEWKKCTFDFKIDHTEIDPNKKIFYQMNIEYWDLFDDEDE